MKNNEQVWMPCSESYSLYDMFKDFEFPDNFYELSEIERIKIVAELLK